MVTLLLISVKPIMSLVNHLSDNNNDIELIEDFDEEDTESELEYNDTFICSKNSCLLSRQLYIKKNYAQFFQNIYFEIFDDILIPPPKSIA